VSGLCESNIEFPSLPSFTTFPAVQQPSMSRPAPSIIDRTKNWIKLLNRRSGSGTIRPDEKTNGGALTYLTSLSEICSYDIPEFFSNAQDFTISDAQFVNELKINYINNVVSSRQAGSYSFTSRSWKTNADSS
jgi:hypothetical protein